MGDCACVERHPLTPTSDTVSNAAIFEVTLNGYVLQKSPAPQDTIAAIEG